MTPLQRTLDLHGLDTPHNSNWKCNKNSKVRLCNSDQNVTIKDQTRLLFCCALLGKATYDKYGLITHLTSPCQYKCRMHQACVSELMYNKLQVTDLTFWRMPVSPHCTTLAVPVTCCYSNWCEPHDQYWYILHGCGLKTCKPINNIEMLHFCKWIQTMA